MKFDREAVVYFGPAEAGRDFQFGRGGLKADPSQGRESRTCCDRRRTVGARGAGAVCCNALELRISRAASSPMFRFVLRELVHSLVR